jgi:hypothetical protein
MDELLGFITQPEQMEELLAGRAEYILQTGETFEEDRSFEARMSSFLDWFVFDRPLKAHSDPPVRIYPLKAGLDEKRMELFRILARTVHGIFELRWVRKSSVAIVDLPTGARYDIPLANPIEGLARGDIFEGRLVPYEGVLHFSPAFIFHPRVIRSLLVEELERQKRENATVPVQELIFMLSRMAARAEHYRYVKLEAIYDFQRPPPKVTGATLKFDRESVTKRLGRPPKTPLRPAEETPKKDEEPAPAVPEGSAA